MDKFEELLKELKSLDIIQTSGDWSECLPNEIWNKHFKGNFKNVKRGIDIDTHRWYETSIEVINIYDKLLGIKGITNIFSEGSDFESCYVKIEFFEMKEVQVVSYKKM